MSISKLASLSRWILILAVSIFASSVASFAQEQTSEEINLEVFRTVFREGFEEGNPEIFRELFAPEFIAHTPDSENTLEIAIATVSSIVTAMPDVTLTEEVVFASGNYVFGRLLFEATFTNPLVTPAGEIPPTGQPVRYIIDSVHRYNEDNLLVEEWLLWDNLSLYTQLGLLPAPGGEA